MTFELIAEIEPPAGPDLAGVGTQVDVLSPISARFLVPDNHTGRATVSSLVVADRVQTLGGRAIACLNARDRNLLGLRRDLLTARHLGVDELLLVHGDDPLVGERSGSLRVREMLEECATEGVRCAVTTRLGRLPAWKRSADRLFVQVSYDLDALLRWRELTDFPGEVYAGVMVLPSAATARRIGQRIAELRAPDELLDALERDRDAGVEHAIALISSIRDSGAFDGVHLVAGRRYRETAGALRTPTSAARVPVGVTSEGRE